MVVPPHSSVFNSENTIDPGPCSESLCCSGDGEPSSFQSLCDLSFGSPVGTLSLLLLLLLLAIESCFGGSLLTDRYSVSSHFILEDVEKQITPQQLPCHPIVPPLLWKHRPCLFFHFLRASLSCCFLLLGSKGSVVSLCPG